ncbi:MAG: DUF4136 domain-containing protein [Pseudomonadales bacterium]|nr:DUF4136 domain-containing protein [Pseudomonadales bacterium]
MAAGLIHVIMRSSEQCFNINFKKTVILMTGGNCTMNRFHVRSLAVLVLLGLLSGCASVLRSDVVTFHEGPLPSGETIRVVPLNPDNAQSLEFRAYARLVSEQLAKIGYTPVNSDTASVDLLAQVDYSVDMGAPDVRLDRGAHYARYHFYYGRYADPFYFGIYDTWTPEVYSYPAYLRRLRLNIVRTDADSSRIFEGRVESTGRQSSLPEIMPYLVSAMFKNFPGESGVTKVVTIEMDE